MSIITAPGAYPDIPSEVYHNDPDICPGPSISSTGLKKLVPTLTEQTKGRTPRHYFEGSPLNPNRKPPETTDALRMGAAFHDALLLPDLWTGGKRYHFLAEGFSRAKTKAMALEIAEAEAAEAAGLVLISEDERIQIDAMVKAMRDNEGINAFLSHGEAEITLAWQDPETGVWLRARPDWLLDSRKFGINVKSAADASYNGFQKDIRAYGYHQSAALELDGYKAIFGHYPTNYLHPVVEKPGKGWEPGDYLPVALWELPGEDIERGRWLNRQAIRRFAECLNRGKWPGYADEPELCGLPGWSRKSVDDQITAEGAAWSAAA